MKNTPIDQVIIFALQILDQPAAGDSTESSVRDYLLDNETAGTLFWKP